MSNPLSGLQMRYLIGADDPGPGVDGTVATVPYDWDQPLAQGISVGYCNLLDETNSGKFGPYLKGNATSKEYNEGQIDPNGVGFEKNLREQFERRRASGFEYVDIDNPDSYAIGDVIRAIDLAASYGLKVIAKNPGLMEQGALTFVAHPNVHGMVVEKDCGTAIEMDQLRQNAGKPGLPVWIIAFGNGKNWANAMAATAQNMPAVGVTYSAGGEYAQVSEVLKPRGFETKGSVIA